MNEITQSINEIKNNYSLSGAKKKSRTRKRKKTVKRQTKRDKIAKILRDTKNKKLHSFKSSVGEVIKDGLFDMEDFNEYGNPKKNVSITVYSDGSVDDYQGHTWVDPLYSRYWKDFIEDFIDLYEKSANVDLSGTRTKKKSRTRKTAHKKNMSKKDKIAYIRGLLKD